MTAATAEKIVGIVKERVALRSKATRFFLDNARRMWGLPEDTAGDVPLSITVSHSYDGPPQSIVQPAPVAAPATSDSSPSMADRIKSALVLAGIPAAVIASLMALWAANRPVTTEPVPSAPVIAVPDDRPGLLLPYLEDMGEHRP